MQTSNPAALRSDRGMLAALVAVAIGLHLATAGRYGIFRDELYYIACARHLDFGYVDHPPLIAWVTWLMLRVSPSLIVLRLLPALAAGLLVYMTAQIAREWGGGHWAQRLAALSIIPVPVYLVLQHWLTMNAFEPLLWTAMLWAASRIMARGEPRYWLAVGALVGVGLENKYSMLFIAAAMVAGFLFTPQRRWLANRYFLAAVGIALLIFLPNLVWLNRHGFPFLEFEQHSRASGSRILREPAAFLWDQVILMNPVLAPVWLGGLGWLLFTQRAAPMRCIGWAALLLIGAMLVLQAKNYYVAPIYPVLFAAGSIALERLTAHASRWVRPAYACLIVVSGVLLAPLVMPILPVPHFLAYQRLWHGFTPVVFEHQPANLLPQYFADEFGWDDMAREAGKVYAALPAAERANTAIFADDYGQASAIDWFGPRYGLPPSISKVVTFWLWGPRQYTGSSVIMLGSDGKGDRDVFRSVEPVGRVSHPYSRADERFDVFLCRGLHPDFAELWPQIRTW